MHPEDYCRTRAAPPGSDLHYSLLGLAPIPRQAIIACYALRRELLDIAASYSDAGVARQKLDWWRRELEQLAAGHPQHPVSRLLLTHADRYPVVADDFAGLIAAAQMDLDYDAYGSFEQLLVYAHHAGSGIAVRHARILGYREQQTTAFAHEAGVALVLSQLLNDVRNQALRGRCYIPDDELQRFGVSHDDLSGLTTTPQIVELFRFQAERIRAYRQRALAYLPDSERGAQRYFLALIELDALWLDEIEAGGFRLLQQHISLTPLRKLWIARLILRREQRRQRAGLGKIESKPA